MPDPRIFTVEKKAATAVDVGLVSTLILEANPNRVTVDLVNLSDPAEAMSLGFGEAAVNGSGDVMTTYGSTYHMGTGNLYLGAIYAICPSGGMFMSVSEGEGI